MKSTFETIWLFVHRPIGLVELLIVYARVQFYTPRASDYRLISKTDPSWVGGRLSLEMYGELGRWTTALEMYGELGRGTTALEMYGELGRGTTATRIDAQKMSNNGTL